MSTNERLHLVAPCGIDCGICELNVCKVDPRLMDRLVAGGIPRVKLPCEGCRNVEGDCPVIGCTCETYICARQKDLEFCYQCEDFPCSKLAPASDRANVLPHNMKVFNLCTIKRDGAEGFVKESGLIRQRYFGGRMKIGKGPQPAE